MIRISARRLLLPAALAVAGTVLGLPVGAGAGCLAPTDAVVDGAAVGPFWGNANGTLLYARDITGQNAGLVRRDPAGTREVLAEQGVRNEFFVGLDRETWEQFHAGTVNSADDVAFVASTSIPDDEGTSRNEALPKRGMYFLRGNTMYELGRRDGPSPIDGLGGNVPWGSFFDAAAKERDSGDLAQAIFSAQLGAPDGRTGIWGWDERTFTTQKLLLVGDDSPDGGNYTSIGRMRANEQGDAVFFAVTRLGQDGPQAAGLFLLPDTGSDARIVKFGPDGDELQGVGVFGILNDFAVDDDRNIWFSASLTNGPSPSGLFRATPPLFNPEVVVREGDATPLGGTFGTFEAAKVRVATGGEVVLGVPLSDDVGGDGLFAIPSDAGPPLPLANPDSLNSVAVLASGVAAYQTPDETHVVAPADGTAAGPDDFRIVKVDVKNNVPLRADSIRFQGAFRLPPVGDGQVAPMVIGPAPQERLTVTRSYTDSELQRVSEVQVSLSQGPGNNFEFGIDNAGGGLLTVNGNPQSAPKLKVTKDGSSATWNYKSAIGRGKFTLDLRKQTFDLKLRQGTVLPSFEALGFRVRFTLRTLADVLADNQDDAAFFHRDMQITGSQPSFGRGRRVTSKGEGVNGGTLFVDTLQVKRKLKVGKGQANPTVTADGVAVTGRLVICPGSTAPGTPGLVAAVRVGDLDLQGLEMTRRGKRGSRYRYKSAKGTAPKVTLDVDVDGGTFKLKATGVPPLTQLANADFSGAAASNRSDADVAGMQVPFSLFVARVYEGQMEVPVVRRKGGRVFER